MDKKELKIGILIATLLSLTLAAVLSGCGSSCDERETAERGPIFPDFESKAYGGKGFTEKYISKGPAVVGFLASWCVPCGPELLALQELHEEYSKNGLKVIVFTYENPSKFEKLIDSLKIDMPVVRSDSAMFAKLKIDAIPTRILLLDRHEIYRIVGAPNHKEGVFRNKVRQLYGLPPEDTLLSNSKEPD